MPVAAMAMFRTLSERLHRRSIDMLARLEQRLNKIALGWFVFVALASMLRIWASPSSHDGGVGLAPYLLLTIAPVATFFLALRWFGDGEALPQPRIRLSQVGQWRNVSSAEAGRHALYGTSGIMLSLLVGMLVNVPVRTAEYLVTMPAISAGAPTWLATLHFAMTVDVVVMSSLYVIAFVMALRRVPSFPRFLVLVWMLDILSQLAVANVGMASGLPPGVAGALHGLLDGNVKKVLISVSLWLPYLILSTRVNVTYRRRVPA